MERKFQKERLCFDKLYRKAIYHGSHTSKLVTENEDLVRKAEFFILTFFKICFQWIFLSSPQFEMR